jgi:hypothetical protein
MAESALARWYRNIERKTPTSLSEITESPVVRKGAEAAVTGALLGAANAELKNGLDVQGKYPIDGIVGVLGLLVEGYTRGPYAKTAGNAGAAALSIFAFRKGQQLWAEKKKQMGGGKTKVHGLLNVNGDLDDAADITTLSGESDEDPIIAAARAL